MKPVKNKFYFVLCGVIILFSNNCYSQFAMNWQWANSAIGTTSDKAQVVASDNAGNVIVAGNFQSNYLVFGTVILTKVGSTDIFIAKYSPSGNFLWAASAGGASDDQVAGITVDSDGNIYLTGYYSSNPITFGNIVVPGNSSENVFLVKYSSSGDTQWAKGIAGAWWDLGNAVQADESGNIYLGGGFESDTIQFGNTTLYNTTAGSFMFDMFLAKYDTAGNAIWAKSAGGAGRDQLTALDIRSNSNIMVSGFFSGATMAFDSTVLSNANAGKMDAFVASFDTAGNFIWAKSAGGNKDDHSNGIAVDGSGNSYVTGNFQSDIFFAEGDSLLNAGGTNFNPDDIFLLKYNAGGDMIWSRCAGGNGQDYPSAIACDANGNSYLTGYFDSQYLPFGNNVGIIAGLSKEILVALYDSSGLPYWAISVIEQYDDKGNDIVIDSAGQVIVCGSFEGFQIQFGNTTLTNSNPLWADIFVCKGSILTGLESALDDHNKIMAFPNPFKDVITLYGTGNPGEITIYDSLGRVVMMVPSNSHLTQLNTSKLQPGFYVVAYTDKQGSGMIKVIK